jgi:hypothetical protein
MLMRLNHKIFYANQMVDNIMIFYHVNKIQMIRIMTYIKTESYYYLQRICIFRYSAAQSCKIEIAVDFSCKKKTVNILNK